MTAIPPLLSKPQLLLNIYKLQITPSSTPSALPLKWCRSPKQLGCHFLSTFRHPLGYHVIRTYICGVGVLWSWPWSCDHAGRQLSPMIMWSCCKRQLRTLHWMFALIYHFMTNLWSPARHGIFLSQRVRQSHLWGQEHHGHRIQSTGDTDGGPAEGGLILCLTK